MFKKIVYLSTLVALASVAQLNSVQAEPVRCPNPGAFEKSAFGEWMTPLPVDGIIYTVPDKPTKLLGFNVSFTVSLLKTKKFKQIVCLYDSEGPNKKLLYAKPTEKDRLSSFKSCKGKGARVKSEIGLTTYKCESPNPETCYLECK